MYGFSGKTSMKKASIEIKSKNKSRDLLKYEYRQSEGTLEVLIFNHVMAITGGRNAIL